VECVALLAFAMRFRFCCQIIWVERLAILTGLLLGLTAPARAQTVTLALDAVDEDDLIATQPARLSLHVLNSSTQAVTWNFPRELAARLMTSNVTVTTTLFLITPAIPETKRIAPGTFARGEYQLTLPRATTGEAVLEVLDLQVGRLLLSVAPPPNGNERTKPFLRRLLKDAEPLEVGKPFDAGRFFEQQIAPHEPMYFIAGAESPNAKFQISFKYQLLNETGPLAERQPWMKNFFAGYTQTSLWDLSAPSAPFFDTSYKPALLYSQERLLGGGERDKFRLDWQMGVQHESNGKSEPDSRSLNIAFVRPTFVFGRNDSFQLTLQPRVWAYLGGLSDNRDLDDYRGYADLRMTLGWRRGLQLATLARMGTDGENHSVQFDLTYPLMKAVRSFSVYLHAQYFTGYGESLLYYNERSDVFRVGFALYR
jgi:outer membrane phospholipase A